MKLNNDAFTGSFTAQVESRIHALQFQFIRAKGADTTGAALIDALSGATLKITKNTRTGTVTKVYEQDIIALLEVGTSEGGSIRAEIIGTNLDLKAIFVLSRQGAELLEDNEFYKVVLSGLADGISANIWVLDAPLNAATQFEFNAMRITANTPKQTNIAHAEYLAIPREPFRSIDLYYPNQQTVTYEAEEIEALVAAGSPLAFIIDGKASPGGYNYYTLAVGSAQTAKIDVSDDCAAILVNEHAL